MSRCLLTYDFFEDGRSDALSEVRILEQYGLWSAKKRARWIKEAVASRSRLMHTRQYQGARYFAGRLAALKSRQTAPFSEALQPVNESSEITVFRPLSTNAERFCSLFDCGSDAIWGACLRGDTEPFVLLCDPCRQEWQRAECAYSTPDGWDWDSDEDALPALPLRTAEQLELTPIILPCTAIVGLGLLNLTLHVSIVLFIVQAVLFIHFIVWGKDLLLKFCKWLASV